MYISARFIPASRVAGCSCTIPASPTTTGLCTLFMITRKLMLIRSGLATQERCPGLSPSSQASSPARPAAASSSSNPFLQHFFCSCCSLRTK